MQYFKGKKENWMVHGGGREDVRLYFVITRRGEESVFEFTFTVSGTCELVLAKPLHYVSCCVVNAGK